jgi:uncharacterized protein (DUF849 family)
MSRPVIITCALTGGGERPRRHPGVPITPTQIAAAAREASQAGAAIVHIHVRDPDTGAGSRDPALYRETVMRIRDAGTTAVINLTGGMGGKFVPFNADRCDLVDGLTRMVHVEELLPDICSLDCGTFNYGSGDETYIATGEIIRTIAKRLQEIGVKPEMEVFDIGHLRLALQLQRDGLIDDPPFFQFAMGVAWGVGADARTMLMMRDMLPPRANWAAFALGQEQMATAGQSLLLGGHIRVGLEDNLYLSRGTFASNGELVERAVRIVEALGERPAVPQEARDILGLRAAVQ